MTAGGGLISRRGLRLSSSWSCCCWFRCFVEAVCWCPEISVSPVRVCFKPIKTPTSPNVNVSTSSGCDAYRRSNFETFSFWPRVTLKRVDCLCNEPLIQQVSFRGGHIRMLKRYLPEYIRTNVIQPLLLSHVTFQASICTLSELCDTSAPGTSNGLERRWPA